MIMMTGKQRMTSHHALRKLCKPSSVYTALTLKYAWSKLAKCVCIMCIASKCARDFDCDWQRVNTFSHCVTLICVLLSQIISYSDTKVLVLVVMECNRASVIYVYKLIFLLHTSRATECMCCTARLHIHISMAGF